ncbi:unnamed protein product [Phaeothamnion confervicola]
MAKGRRYLVSQPKYRHILDLRCQMHAFNLLYSSFFRHPVPKSIMRTVQQMVMFVRTSHEVGELVRQKARELSKKSRALKTSNKTRFTFGEASLSSIAELEDVLQNDYGDASALFQHKPERVAILSDRWRDFWRQLRKFLKLLLPISKVITMVQSDECTLADITRFWLYLAKDLVDVMAASELTAEYISHAAAQYIRRVQALHLDLHRLALFRDPTHKLVGAGGGDETKFEATTDAARGASPFEAAEGPDGDPDADVLGEEDLAELFTVFDACIVHADDEVEQADQPSVEGMVGLREDNGIDVNHAALAPDF